MRKVKIFVSSPRDVANERKRVAWIAERLNGEFRHVVEFDTILWESDIYTAHDGGYQRQIDQRATPADCDIVISLFWGRLGTTLPDSFSERMPDGSPYPSGTAYEVLIALEARRQNGHRPDVYVFRKNEFPSVPVNDTAAIEDAKSQWGKLEEFFEKHFELADKRILRAVEKFRTTSEFEEKIDRLLRKWIETNTTQGAVWPIEVKGSPFRGLEPFDAKHKDAYCGRGRKVARAIDELQSAARRGTPFLLVVGASGSGKSSLVRAGMAPRIIEAGAVAAVDVWRVAVMRPGDNGDPMLSLANALFVKEDSPEDVGGFGSALPELAQGAFPTPGDLSELLAGPANSAIRPICAALDDVAKSVAAHHNFDRPLRTHLLLVVDQLEDIFAAGVSKELRATFANLVSTLVATQRVWVVATLRGDMYERVITERPFVELKDTGGQFDLSPPGPDELDEIVHVSASVAGLEYEHQGAGSDLVHARDRLDDRLLRDAAGENTLPLLQFALNLLFEKCWVREGSKVLTIAAYNEFGGLDGAIDQTAETALAKLTQPIEGNRGVAYPLPKDVAEDIDKSINPILEALLRKLAVPVGQEQYGGDATGERALTARVVPLNEAQHNDPQGATAKLIDALLNARILIAPQTSEGSWLRIAHDRVLTSWNRARRLTEKNRDFYRVKESIEHQRQLWDESQRSPEFLIPAGAPIAQAEDKVRQFEDEFSAEAIAFVRVSGRRARRRQRLMQIATLVFAVVAVIASAASWYANEQRQRAANATVVAVKAGENAKKSYDGARGVVDGIITIISESLMDLEDVGGKTIEVTLNHVDDLVDKLRDLNENDLELQRLSAKTHYEFGNVFKSRKKRKELAERAQEGLAVRKRLAEQNPGQKALWAEYAFSLDQVGDVHRLNANDPDVDPQFRVQEFEKSRRMFDEAIEIRIRLYNEDKENHERAFQLSQSLVRIGDHKDRPEKNLAGAKADYERALELMIAAISRDPEEKEEKYVRELSWAFNKIGDILVLQKDPEAAIERYEKGLCVRRYLAAKDESNTLRKRDLGFSLQRLAEANFKANRPTEAVRAFEESLFVRKKLTQKDAFHGLWFGDLMKTYGELGKFAQDQGRHARAIGFFQLEVRERTEWANLNPDDKFANKMKDVAIMQLEHGIDVAKKKEADIEPGNRFTDLDAAVASAEEFEKNAISRFVRGAKKDVAEIANDWKALKAELIQSKTDQRVAKQSPTGD